MARGINKQGLLRNVQNINTTLKNLAKEFETANRNLTTMMKGDANGPYWNGSKAKRFYTAARNNLKGNAKDYSTALNRLNTIALQYELQAKGDK